jgi:virginiamycin A acetyltransferase
MTAREIVKALGRGLAVVFVLPALASFHIRGRILGPNKALEGSSQTLALIPGNIGDYIRRAFLARTLAHVDQGAVISFGTLFSQTGARIDRNAYIGPNCHLGLVHLEADVMLAAGVHVPSGPDTHGTSDADKPMRDQPGHLTVVKIGTGSWIGSAAVVLADVGAHCVIGAGAVVTHAVPDYSIAVGVPARVIGDRRQKSSTS